MTADIATRLWARVQKGAPDDCWPWLGARSGHGYGQIASGGRSAGAHRISWETANGPIPRGMVICHSCDNPPCCNPAHLFLGTPADNAADRESKGRGRQPIGLNNGRARLTADEVAEIRRRHVPGARAPRRTGGSVAELAQEFGISKTHVYDLVASRWRKTA